MAQPKLVSPDQPFALRILLRGYEFYASLKLAVVLIFAMAFALGYATFVEAAYGTPVVQYFVYQTWWFNGLNILLGINIFCAAAIRYPWQRHQTGFVVTHIGLLVLLGGAAIGRQSGVDAQIPVFENRMERYAFDRTNLFFDVKLKKITKKGPDITMKILSRRLVESRFLRGHSIGMTMRLNLHTTLVKHTTVVLKRF